MKIESRLFLFFIRDIYDEKNIDMFSHHISLLLFED